jgi:hypothetical protein
MRNDADASSRPIVFRIPRTMYIVSTQSITSFPSPEKALVLYRASYRARFR